MTSGQVDREAALAARLYALVRTVGAHDRTAASLVAQVVALREPRLGRFVADVEAEIVMHKELP